ncbi:MULTISPECIES: serine hydrolase domain-containing protein [unclassified Sphingomonas]|uniref:serine hydrolase domain-containing protein n=1 Tax=unclassified Sphingomonas TaxID=196159 RepID=UPI0009284F5A|nr:MULTISPECIES: serine hydrolase domain-containing protein [unclassified Sphingomonas]MBN8850001.1 beta-lactamase family protein [Sphingomonas sp.]OJV32273.1 MAG: hypothetical protein BGO24_15975 [Sphingomonas sp. 67-36]
MAMTLVRDAAVEKELDRIFAPYDQCEKPGTAVAVAVGGTPIYRKGFGLANMDLPVLLSPAMRMRIGSTTKHFTSLAYMLLCEEGRAGIDDPVERHIPEINKVAHGITMRQLMGHIGGLRDSMSLSLLLHGNGTPIAERDLVAYYEVIDDLDFPAGTAWSYNNGGYILLTAAIERLTGETLDSVLERRIFRPLGMKDTLMRRWDNQFVPNSAALHMLGKDGRYVRDGLGMEISGAGGLVSSMDDMLIWLKHLDAPVIGSNLTWQLMREPQRLANGTSTGYGLGLITGDYRGARTLMHGGSVAAGNSQMIKLPDVGLDISVAVNRSDASAVDLANQIIDALVEGLNDKPARAGDGRRATYVSSASRRVVRLSEHDGAQLLSYDGTPPMPVDDDGDGGLQPPSVLSYLQMRFTAGAGRGTLNEFGNADEMVEIEPDPDARLGNRVGVYDAGAVGALATLTENGDGAQLSFRDEHGGARFRLEPITDLIWRASYTGAFAAIAGILTFDADGGGFWIAGNRLGGVRFQVLTGRKN